MTQFDEVVDLVSDGIETGRGRRGAYLHHDAVNGELRARKGRPPGGGDLRAAPSPRRATTGS